MLYMYSGVLLKNTRIPIFEILYVYDIYINIYLTLMSRIILNNSSFFTPVISLTEQLHLF